MKIGGSDITTSVEVQQYKGSTNQAAAITTDSETKSFQNQIASAQTQLQKLSADNKMSSEEKAEKRREIQKQIMELNNMLKERKAELRREKQQKAAEAEEKQNQDEEALPGQQKKPETVHIEKNVSSQGISSRHMKAVISADAAIDKAELTDNISNELKSRVQVLEGEIRQAENNGGYVEAKKGEIEALENKVSKISGAKMNIINGAISEMKQAVKEAGRKDKGQNTNEAVKQADVPSKDFTTRKQQVDTYTKGKMFSNVEFHF